MIPSINIFGINYTGNKSNFIPHYKELANVHSNCRITEFDSNSAMFTSGITKNIDFWNSDADFFYIGDLFSYNNIMSQSPVHFDYFSQFKKIYMIDHSLWDEPILKGKLTKNKLHLMDILQNLVISDVVMISPVLREDIKPFLTEYFSTKTVDSINKKFFVAPPAGFYKIEKENNKKEFNELVFLWNHRFTNVKNYEAFFRIIEKFKITHNNIPIKVIVTSLDTEQKTLSFIPKSLHSIVKIYPFTKDKIEYEKIVSQCNITIGTSIIESFGISVFDSIKKGLLYLNLECNKSFKFLGGHKCTFSEDDLVIELKKVFDDSYYREFIFNENNKVLNSLMTKKQFNDSFNNHLLDKLERKEPKSEKLSLVIKELEKDKVLTKQDIYNIINWKVYKNGKALTSFWGNYYYSLRKLGVKTTFNGNKLYYHLNDFKPNIVGLEQFYESGN